MMNHDNQERALSYGLTPDELMLDPATIDRAPDLEVMELLAELLNPEFQRHDPHAAHRTLDMALALFAKLMIDADHTYDEFYRLELFAASLDTAMIWECG